MIHLGIYGGNSIAIIYFFHGIVEDFFYQSNEGIYNGNILYFANGNWAYGNEVGSRPVSFLESLLPVLNVKTVHDGKEERVREGARERNCCV